MRVWINNLSGEERYLHKAALAIAQLVQSVTATNPTVGFTLLSQLLGKNGNRNFDKITKTKTVSGIMASLSTEGVQDFVDYLKGLVNESQAGPSSAEFDYKQVDARRTWIFDQLVSLIKNTTVPKTDAWVSSVLEFFVVHGLFSIKSANKKSPLTTVSSDLLPLSVPVAVTDFRDRPFQLHTVPHPALSDAVHVSSRTRLSSILGELSTESTLVKGADGKTKRAVGCDSTGKLWTSRALDMVAVLEKDTKHVRAATEDVEEVVAARKSAQAVLKTLEKVRASPSFRPPLYCLHFPSFRFRSPPPSERPLEVSSFSSSRSFSSHTTTPRDRSTFSRSSRDVRPRCLPRSPRRRRRRLPRRRTRRRRTSSPSTSLSTC